MTWNVTFVLTSALLGVGLAMDAFSVSLANGLQEPGMSKGRMCAIAGVFGGFQALMPMVGWLCVHTVLRYFEAFARFIPFIALALLAYIGGKMVLEGLGGQAAEALEVGTGALLLQGIATSIDALSVGFTIAEYRLAAALGCSAIIAAVTFVLCLLGLSLGKRFGTKLSGKANLLGGVILIAIGLKIFFDGLLG